MNNKTTTIAYMCSDCNDFAVFDINIFDFSGNRKKICTCDCGKSEISIVKNTTKSFKVELKCPVCQEVHSFVVPYNQFWSDDVFTFSCLYYEANLLFVGNKEKLEKQVKSYISEELSATEVPEGYSPDYEVMDKIVKINQIVYSNPEKVKICDCKASYSIAYNEKGIYIICDKCNISLPVSFDRVDLILNELENN